MALSLSQAKVLGLLYALEKTATVQILADLTGLAESTTSTALHTLRHRGLVACGTTMPTPWHITATGSSIIGRPCYREYRDHPRLTTR